MNTRSAVDTVLSSLSEKDIALFATGFISREAFDAKDRDSNFYLIGSMGLISSIGLGIALNSKKRIFIFDGDGSALMELGTLAMIANHRPSNLFHIVLDNEKYASTGGQPSISKDEDLSCITRALGYKRVFKIDNITKLRKSCKNILKEKGPVLVLLKVKDKNTIDIGRVSIAPERLTSRIIKVIRKNKRGVR